MAAVIELSRAGYRKKRQDLWRAAGGLAPSGVGLCMSRSALLTSVSSVVFALNAQLLRRLDL